MTKTTANGASAILEVAQSILKDGRPRKPLGKPRPVEKQGKMSLIGALRYAKLILGATRRQYEAAINAAEEAAWLETRYFFRSHGSTAVKALAEYDAMEPDTRNVIRILGVARKRYL